MSLDKIVMEHWMNEVKKKISELESSDKIYYRYVDSRLAHLYFSPGEKVIGKEALWEDISFKYFQERLSQKAVHYPVR